MIPTISTTGECNDWYNFVVVSFFRRPSCISNLFPLALFISNESAMANTAFEDVYLTILDVDGPEATDKLRLRMNCGTSAVSSEQSWLLSPSV
jgi:hypothetical protein